MDKKKLEEKIKFNVDEKNKILKNIHNESPLDYSAIVNECHTFTDKISKYVSNTSEYLNDAIAEGKSVLLEWSTGNFIGC